MHESMQARIGRFGWLWIAVLVALPACGGQPRGPLAVPMFGERAAVRKALADQKYCRREGPMQPKESFDRCDEPGLELASSWVDTEYGRDGRLVAVRRFERHATHADATERWQQLVAERRRADGEPSERARQRIAEKIPPHAASWRSWYGDSSETHVITLYLVKSEKQSEPNVIEEMIATPESL
jgi:hypothetical protein